MSVLCLPLLPSHLTSIYLSVLMSIYFSGHHTVASTVEELLDRGHKLLASQKLNDALSLYDQAIEKDKKNYLPYFMRGTTHLAMGNIKLALADFEVTGELNSGYIPAIKQRAHVYLKQGRLKDAKYWFDIMKTKDEDAITQLKNIDTVEHDLASAIKELESRNYKSALNLLNGIAKITTHDGAVLDMKSTCLLQLGDPRQGIEVKRQSVHLINDNRPGILQVSKLMYEAGYAVQALEEIRECLRLDQDDEACKKHYRIVKKLADAIIKSQEALEASDYTKCIDKALLVLKLEPTHHEYQLQTKIILCKCYSQTDGPTGIEYCNEIVQHYPDNFDYQCDLADAYLNAEKFEDAIQTYQSVLGKESQNQRARKGLARAQKLLKASKRINYYEVLGVKRTASKSEIMRAYHKLAKTHHPDKDTGSIEKFRNIATAKEILTDPKKREMFDNGIDPNDPEQQQQQHSGGGFPFNFNNMHQHFQGGNFEFHFG